MCDENKTKEQLVGELAAMRERIAELGRILEISRELTSARELEPLMKSILATTTELTDSEEASILLEDTPGGELHFLTSFGATSGKLLEADISVPIEGSIAGAVFTSRKPVVVLAVQADPRFYSEVDRQSGFEAKSLLGVPLNVRDRCIGVLEALNKRNGRDFSQEDVDVLVTLAAHAAVAIENARLYQEVRDHVETLEERVRERTAAFQARNEELTGYDRTVAHDLKNPLALVVGWAEVLEQQSGNMPREEIQRHLGTVVQAGRRMHRIIDELLLFSGVRDMEVAAEPLDTAGIVDDVQQRLALVIADSAAEIVLPETWPVALGYGPWIGEVWANYISNAIKYGGEPPRVELGATEQADGSVRFWVRDNGPGISPEEQTGLFTRFTRLDRYRHRAEGHGLGLSIVRRVAEKLGGQAGVESEVGQGSTFFFSLPGPNRPE